MDKNLVSNFILLSFSQKKVKLLKILNQKSSKNNQSTIDLIGFIDGIPEGKDEPLVDVYRSMISSVYEIHNQDRIINSIDRGIYEMNQFEMNLDEEKEHEDAENILDELI